MHLLKPTFAGSRVCGSEREAWAATVGGAKSRCFAVAVLFKEAMWSSYGVVSPALKGKKLPFPSNSAGRRVCMVG